jgi:uncharacterized protein YraI
MRNTTLLRSCLAAALCAGVVAPCLADPATTTAPSAMRRAPNPHSRIVQMVPADAEIDLQNCNGGWCYGSWRNLFGWIPSFAVAQAGPPPAVVGPPPVVVAPSVVVGVGPAWGWGHPYGWGGYGWRGW